MTTEQMKFYRNNYKGFINEIGFQLTDVQPGYAKGELTLTDMHRNPIGSTHGGVMYAMADTIAGTAASSYGKACTTVSGTMHYLNAAMNCRKLIGESHEVKVGKHMAVFDVLIKNECGTEIASATMTFYYMGPVEDFMKAGQPDMPETSETEK